MGSQSTSVLHRYQANPDQSKQLKDQCIRKIEEFNLSCNPIHFTLVYEWLSEVDPYLSEELDRVFKLAQYDDETAENLFIKLIAQLLYKSLPAEKTGAILNQLLFSLDRWMTNTQQKQQLIQNEIELMQSNPMDDNSFARPFDRISCTLQELVENTQSLHQQVNDSTQEIRLLKEELERTTTIAKTDELTNIPNRRGFNEIIELLSRQALDKGSTFAIVLLDIDHFKSINDTFGHLIGDSVLRYLAKLLHRETKGQDSIARFGGEEFAILLPDTGYSDAINVANNIRKKIAARPLQVRSSNQPLQITVSAGVAMYQLGEEIETLLTRVDECLYKAKGKGRNRIVGESDY
ncbi:GGDEF domain-containing protein [Thiomicrorhabdus cannonii]|uniref:GGDEF domain-containing protein n=1 Tax=Thiomicrorhabdus cannonii TaxID=2748011 RepID=UPI0015C0E655|nr:GGDEF domain-containing protein [Thiomicrorhabdus cannonii]